MTTTVPDLEPRFQQPKNWHWGTFTNPKGRKLRYGSLMPENSKAPRAIVVILPGLSEFGEKYFETARNMQERGLGVFIMDWQGQGKSDRHLKNPHKRHTDSFDEDIDDINYFLTNIIQKETSAPLIMIGHSMGGNIGLRYLLQHPDIFSCAAFSAPMMGINDFRNMPYWLVRAFFTLLHTIAGTTYTPGGGDWEPRIRPQHAKDLLSSDPVRNALHDIWCHHDPALQVGNVTFSWVYAAVHSCGQLQKNGALQGIKIPCLLASAGHDKLVNGPLITHAAQKIPHAKLIELPESRHEILMERDESRAVFLSAFDDLLTANQIGETLDTH